MSNSPDVLRSFEDNVREKLRKDIGDLIPPEALAKLVERAIEDNFFKERVVNDGGFRTKQVPSFFVEEVGKLMKPILAEYISKIVEENKDLIVSTIKDTLSKEMIMLSVVNSIVNRMDYDIQHSLGEINDKLTFNNNNYN